MNAVILAAGTGSRLRPLTIDQPKACLTVDGTPIAEHQIRAYDDAGIETVFVVTGYMPKEIQSLCDRLSEELAVEIQTVHNPAFANTDNMYSLYCARRVVGGEPFLLSNGDVVFDPEIVHQVTAADADSAIAIDTGTYDPEAMKITVDAGKIDGISKEIIKRKLREPRSICTGFRPRHRQNCSTESFGESRSSKPTPPGVNSPSTSCYRRRTTTSNP